MTRSIIMALLLVFSYSNAASAQSHDTLEDTLELEDAPSKQKALPLVALNQLLARYAHEPSVQLIVAAALQVARGRPGQFADMASRSRLRGLIPHLDLGVRRGQGIDLRWTTPSDDLAGNRTTADDLMLFATLRFNLDQLLFSNEEVGLAREQRAAHDAQHELIRKVVRVYFLRKRLLLERDLQGGTSIAQQLRILEAEALLNAFTDGAFQRMLRQNSLPAWKIGAGTKDSARP